MSSAAVARPPFQTVFRSSVQANSSNASTSTSSIFGDDRKERKFREWKSRNLERMKAANIRPKVYQFSRPPKVVEDRYV